MPGTRKLGRTADHRTAMLRAMVTYLMENGKIETTVTRAKEVRSVAEKIITTAKRGDLHADHPHRPPPRRRRRDGHHRARLSPDHTPVIARDRRFRPRAAFGPFLCRSGHKFFGVCSELCPCPGRPPVVR